METFGTFEQLYAVNPLRPRRSIALAKRILRRLSANAIVNYNNNNISIIIIIIIITITINSVIRRHISSNSSSSRLRTSVELAAVAVRAALTARIVLVDRISSQERVTFRPSQRRQEFSVQTRQQLHRFPVLTFT